jgi:hypothetical protein
MTEFNFKYKNDKNKLIIKAENEEQADKALEEILKGFDGKKENWKLIII